HGRRARSRSARDLMTSAHGRPTAAELIAAVAEFLETDVRESTAGQVNFHSRVAANALRMVERELLGDAEAADAVAGALARVGCVDEAQLAAAIRCGELDGGNDHAQSGLGPLGGRRLAAAPPRYQDEYWNTPCPRSRSSLIWPMNCSRQSSAATRHDWL